MQLREIIGSTISNIYAVHTMEFGGMDTAECFVELNHKLYIDIPYAVSEEIWIKELNKEAISLFENLEDRKILDVLWYDEPGEKCYLLLDNGFLISETITAMNGTGNAGLHLFESLDELIQTKGKNYFKLVSK